MDGRATTDAGDLGRRLAPGTNPFRRAVAALFVGGTLTFAILHCTQPLMPIFSERFGVSPATASLSMSAATATLAVSLLVAAALPGSRKVIMTVSLFGTAFLTLLLALSPGFGSLLAVRALQGMVLAGLPSVAMAYVGEEFRPEGLGVAMGLYVSGTSFGGMAGRISSGVLADAFSWRVAVGAVGVVAILGAVLFWIALPPPSNSSPRATAKQGSGEGPFKPLLRPLRDPGLVCVFALGFLLLGSFMILFNYVGYLLLGPPYGLSQAAVGMLFSTYLAGTFSSAWMGRLADRHGRPKVLGAGVAIMTFWEPRSPCWGTFGRYCPASSRSYSASSGPTRSPAGSWASGPTKTARRRPPPCTCSPTTRAQAWSGPRAGCSGIPTAGPGW